MTDITSQSLPSIRSWLRSHLRPLLLPSKPLRHRRSPHGPLGSDGREEKVLCRIAEYQRDGQKEIVSGHTPCLSRYRHRCFVRELNMRPTHLSSPTHSFQLAGRVLLIFLFVGFVFQGNWSLTRIIVALLGLVACIMVIAGFKARWSASFLVTLLSVANLFVNNWWTMHAAHPQRDFKMYDL